MKIGYVNNKMEKKCRNAIKFFGKPIGVKVEIRLADLAAFKNLSLVPHEKPWRCHKLESSELEFSIDLTGNWRMIFIPEEPYEIIEGKGLVKESVEAIIITEIKDPH